MTAESPWMALTHASCLGVRDGGPVAHTEPVPLERNEMLDGWWCPVCRRLIVGDEMVERTSR